ncbi:MAG: ABC transporter ATP-binding protein [Bacilli bacterium]
MDNIIRLKDIYKNYDNTEVLHGINLEVKHGEFCALIGQSGSGKSTILNIMGTLDKQTSGTVEINGRDTTNLSNNELAVVRNSDLGFIFQFHYLLYEFSVLENVLMPQFISERKASYKNEDYALELIDLVGLGGLENRNSAELSGGQKQRVAIARALMNKPQIILADEPTGNLDSKTTELIYDLFRKINLEYNTTVIIITHDKNVAEKTDRIIEINDGEIVADIYKNNVE